MSGLATVLNAGHVSNRPFRHLEALRWVTGEGRIKRQKCEDYERALEWESEGVIRMRRGGRSSISFLFQVLGGFGCDITVTLIASKLSIVGEMQVRYRLLFDSP